MSLLTTSTIASHYALVNPRLRAQNQRVETESLGSWLKTKREALGKTQTAIAVEVGIAPAYLSQIESGKITLPNPDLRRRLAKALGVSHLQLLIAAGEITDDEIALTGFTGVVEREPDPNADAVVEALMQASPISERERNSLIDFIGYMRGKP